MSDPLDKAHPPRCRDLLALLCALLFASLISAASATTPLHDPLAPLPVPTTASPSSVAMATAPPTLSATLSGPEAPLARIDGRWLTLGEAVDGRAVLAISRGRVTLGPPAAPLTLTLEVLP